MKRKLKPSSPPWRRGLTLVEVLAALVIMSTLLAGIVMAKARHTRQIALTRQRMLALHSADDLIARWWNSPQGVPLNQQGALDSDWNWETRVRPDASLGPLGLQVVNVEVRPAQPQAGLSSENDGRVSIDLVVPTPRASSAAPSDASSEDKE